MKCWICGTNEDLGSSPNGHPECTWCSKAQKMFADDDRLEMEASQ